jgi:hypothetical protein
MLTRFADAFGPLELERANTHPPAPAMVGRGGPTSRWAQRGATRCTGDARIHHGDTESTEASRSSELGVRSKAVPGRGPTGAEARLQGGERRRALSETCGTPKEQALAGCARRRAQRGTLEGCFGRPGRPLSMTVGSAPCSSCEGSGLGDPSQPEGRLEEMAPGPPGVPAPPFFQGPPCVPLCSPCLRGKKTVPVTGSQAPQERSQTTLSAHRGLGRREKPRRQCHYESYTHSSRGQRDRVRQEAAAGMALSGSAALLPPDATRRSTSWRCPHTGTRAPRSHPRRR